MTEARDPIATFGEALLEVGDKYPNVVALSADSSSGSGLAPFGNKYPERHIEFGIMEQGVIGFASGLATTGKIPFVAAIAPFMTARPFEMFRNDLGYMRQNVKVVGRSSGLTYSDLGATHQSLDDIAIIRTIPGVTVVSPGDPVELKQATHAIAAHVGPVYMKIGRGRMPVLFDQSYQFELGKAVVIKPGGDVAVIATGMLLSKAYDAVQMLEGRGIQARLVNVHTIKPLDVETIVQAAEETGGVVTVEEHYRIGGLGGAVAEVLAQERPTPMRFIGVDDQFATSGPYEELLELYGLQGPQIADTVQDFVQTRLRR
ncbi:MAG: transketolase [Anaerolineae bacterium]|nr:transketolase [Anaerolineae bacterium]